MSRREAILAKATSIPGLAANAIETAANDGIVSGYADAEGNATGLFKPLDFVNRAEVAKMITLALQVYGG